jgi:serine/threonine protein kinase/tetratricopeptide (TPR) repeat protein
MLELKQGAQLADRYTLARRLGGESKTQTWLAKDRLTKASVVLKIAPGDVESATTLRAEWQASIRLMHAHIVRVFEFHIDESVAFFSQQFIDGPTLGVLTGHNVDDVLGPVGWLVDALGYVHDKGLVHRDIKASNVLIDGNGAPYLSDFGIACPVGSTGSGGSLVAQSPQSLRGEPATTADDIFALGSLLYELLSGRPPWSETRMADDIANVRVAPLVAADGAALPEVVVRLVMQMLDKDASKRPSTKDIAKQLVAAGYPARVANVRGASTPVLGDELIQSTESIHPVSRPPGEAPRAVKQETSGLKPKTVGIALGVLVIVLMGVVFVLPDSVSTTSGPPNESAAVVDATDVEAAAANDDTPAAGRAKVYVDPEIRKRIKGLGNAPTRKLAGDADITFAENSADYSGLDEVGRARFSAESTLGELLSALEILKGRGVERWAVTEYRAAQDLYAAGDKAYLERDFAYAEELYLGALTILEPLYARIEPTFQNAYDDAVAAFEAGDWARALSSYELAVAITPSHADANAGYQRTKNLKTVLALVDQGVEYEEDLELDAALSSFEQAANLDPLWQPALDGIQRVKRTRTEIEFDTRMTEGFDAIAEGDFLGARAAFRVAQQLMPESTEPADGLLQVDQGLRLQDINTLEREALALEADEHWDAVVQTYEEILKVDSTLAFARDGLARGREMSALHARLEELIADPDRLSVPSVMQDATKLLVSVTTRAAVGQRLAEQRDELSRLLKRAATPLTVPIVSDNVTEVMIYRIGKLGRFMRKEVNLRPGTYVAVGSRNGFRDVRREFRVAPEIEMQPIVVQCEETI